MSEKLCALLVRLYPSAFRQRYGEEALRLVIDRARDEKGGLRQLRLWIDMIRDLVATAPLYGSQLPVSQISRAPDGSLSFQFVGRETPSAAALFMGVLAALTLLAAFPLGFRGSESAGNWNSPKQPTMAQIAPRREEPQHVSERQKAPKIDAAEQQELIQRIAANLKDHYVDPAAATKMAEVLQANEISGVYKTVTDSQDFASLLTRQLREVSQDPHIEVVYSERPLLSDPSRGFSAEALNDYRAAMLRQNCTFEKPQMLPDKIGYLKFNSFPSTAACQEAAQAAMAELNQAQSVVLDLRDNSGGFPDMVMLIASYFFDHPEYMYNPRENTTEQSWTRSPVEKSTLTNKPLFLLTSSRTISAAEQFSYDLKALKRATLVGETTRGSAHSGVFHRIDDHFGIGITEVRPINPFSKADWEGVGVEPDVKVKAADALPTAVALARMKSRN